MFTGMIATGYHSIPKALYERRPVHIFDCLDGTLLLLQ